MRDLMWTDDFGQEHRNMIALEPAVLGALNRYDSDIRAGAEENA